MNAAMFPMKVRQRQFHDCGVACAAMVAGVGYEEAQAAFIAEGLNVHRGRCQPWSSNFRELMAVLVRLGLSPKRKTYRGWSEVGESAIMKVMVQKSGNWHWVAAVRLPSLGLCVFDPESDLTAFPEGPPSIIPFLKSDGYIPKGAYIALQKTK